MRRLPWSSLFMANLLLSLSGGFSSASLYASLFSLFFYFRSATVEMCSTTEHEIFFLFPCRMSGGLSTHQQRKKNVSRCVRTYIVNDWSCLLCLLILLTDLKLWEGLARHRFLLRAYPFPSFSRGEVKITKRKALCLLSPYKCDPKSLQTKRI